MKLICPSCQTIIPSRDINVAADLAQCKQCDEIFKASELVERQELEDDLNPPSGSEIEYRKDKGIYGEITIPRSGFSASDTYPIIFATFWLGFVAFWTVGAASGSVVFAMFSIPFWLVGLGMWYGIIRGATESQCFTFERDYLVIARHSIFGTYKLQPEYSDVSGISIENFIPRDPFSMTRNMKNFQRMNSYSGGIQQLLISHGTKKTPIAENTSEAEMEWLKRVLNYAVDEIKNK